VAELFETNCSECDNFARRRLTRVNARREDREALEGSSFPCEHWGDHHEAVGRAPRNKSGRRRADGVSARQLLLG